MVLFNYTTKELTAKIVYYGPGLCGKTTNLQYIYDGLPTHVKKGKMLSLATKTDRTLFFDFLPIELGRIRGMRTRVQLYTVPGQVFYNSTRKLVLKGADGIVFVADSQQKMMESDIESYKNLEENLQEIGLKLDEMPLVMQFNKRDLPNLASVEEMNTLINRHNAPFYEAVATTGIGVEDTLKAVTKLVLNHLAMKYHLGTSGPEKAAESETASVAPAPATGSETIFIKPSPARTTAPPPEPVPLADEETYPLGESDRDALGTGHPDRDAGRAHEEIEILELEEDLEPSAPEVLSAADTDDLSDLLEEIPEDAPEQALESLQGIGHRKTFDDARPPAISQAPPSMPKPEPVGAADATLPVARRIAPGTKHPSEDPLGIMAARSAESPESPTIQVGAVTPGTQHQVTVPLEMSVEGRPVRLQLKLTLTLST